MCPQAGSPARQGIFQSYFTAAHFLKCLLPDLGMTFFRGFFLFVLFCFDFLWSLFLSFVLFLVVVYLFFLFFFFFLSLIQNFLSILIMLVFM